MTQPSAAALPGAVVPLVPPRRPAADDLICRRCHRRTEPGSADACTWWPNGCGAGPGGRRALVCWDCCDEDERLDLVDAGCARAAIKIRNWQ